MSASAKTPKHFVHPGYSDDTGPRILAYLAAVRAPQDCVFRDGGKIFYRGHTVIAHMSMSAKGLSMPTVRLSLADCADALFFVRHCEPIDPATWDVEPTDAPSHLVGESFVLETVEAALRSHGRKS